ncbi:hypothetical protein VTO42DRAFT_4938 [Malbranchea cinnamomea]
MEALSAGEQRLINAAFLIFAGDNLANFKVNANRLAEATGLTPGSASVLFNKAKRKFAAALQAQREKDGAPNNEGDTGTAATPDASPKKATAEKTAKRARKPRATKAKVTEEASENGPDEGPIKTDNESCTANDEPQVTSEGPPAAKEMKKKRPPPRKKVKTEHVGDDRTAPPILIGSEPEVTHDPLFENFAKGILEGTMYPQTKEAWMKANEAYFVAQAYLSATEGTASSSSTGSSPTSE